MSLHHVYTLPLKDGCFYVGSTTDPIERLTSHLSGTGSKWTMAHPVVGSPIRLVSVNGEGSLARIEEDAEVKRMMNVHGIDKVRGGSYCQEVLPDEQISALQRELNHANNNCLRCGRNGHFASNCFAINDSNGTLIPPRAASNRGAAEAPTRGDVCCYRCGREGHFADKCYAQSDTNGHIISNQVIHKVTKNILMKKSGANQHPAKSLVDVCHRCGRVGHSANGCYAKSDTNGQSIPNKSTKISAPKESRATQSQAITQGGVCHRCGRKGHFADGCYAKRDVSGIYVNETSPKKQSNNKFESKKTYNVKNYSKKRK